MYGIGLAADTKPTKSCEKINMEYFFEKKNKMVYSAGGFFLIKYVHIFFNCMFF